MFRFRLPFAFLSMVLAFGSLSATAQVVYDNGVGGAAGVSDGFSSDDDVTIYGADDFVLTTSASLTGVRWTGLYAFLNTPPLVDDFTIDIYADGGGLPGPLLGSTHVGNLVNRVDSGFDEPLFGFDIYEYSASIDPFNAIAGNTYWLVVRGNTVGEDDDWLWGIVNGGGNSAESDDSGASWFSAGHQMDFQLLGTAVPEPSGVGMAAFLLGGFLLRRRRAA